MMGFAFLVACRCNSCSFFYNVCTFAFGEINILLLHCLLYEVALLFCKQIHDRSACRYTALSAFSEYTVFYA